MGKVMNIDLSFGRILGLAEEKIDRHDYIGALKMLNKNAETAGNDATSFMMYAEVFDDMGLREKCINSWFKFMNEPNIDDEIADCYEGLAIAYMGIGNEQAAAYYYNKLIMESDEFDALARREFLKDFLSTEENPLKFSYPPEIADCSDIMSHGMGKMRIGDYDGAIEEFDKIAEGNERYYSARNYVAMCRIISDKDEEALEECLNILKHRPNDIQALSTLAAVKREAGDIAEAKAIAEKLLTLKVRDTEDVYKIATVCCENGLHEDAYNLFCKLSEDFYYDINVLYFKAVSAFNCGKYKESFEAFDWLVTIYPNAVTGRYYYTLAREAREKNEQLELSYFYRLPQDLRTASYGTLAALMKLSEREAKKLAGEMDLKSCLLWSFDEGEPKLGDEVHRCAAHIAIKCRCDDMVNEILLNAFIEDKVKVEMLMALAERNEFNTFGVVVCHIYKNVSTACLELGRSKKKLFLRAYARLVAHFSLIDDMLGDKFAYAAEKIYYKLEDEGRLATVKDLDVLTAAIYVKAKVNVAEVRGNNVYEFFGVDKDSVKELLS